MRTREVTQSCATVGAAEECPDHSRLQAGGDQLEEKQNNKINHPSCATVDWPGYLDNKRAISGVCRRYAIRNIHFEPGPKTPITCPVRQ